MERTLSFKEDILLFSSMKWNDLWTRKQRFALMLSEMGCRVMYVEQRVHSRGLWSKKGVGLRGRVVDEPSSNLTIFRLPVAFPFTGKFRVSKAISNWHASISLRNLMKSKEFETPILWSINPYIWDFLFTIENKLFIHEVIDELSEYPRPYPNIIEIEKKVLQRADLVFVTASGLLKTKGPYNPHTYLVPNGVDFDFFSRFASQDISPPEDLKSLPHPILGFVGGVHSWLNFDLIREVAVRRPQWTFVFVGPVGDDAEVSKVNDIDNVHFLGRKPKEEVPLYVGAFDVCINPFKLERLAEYVNPLKVYEYLAMGRPVVSTSMPELLRLSDVLYLADETEGWVSSIDKAIREDNKERQQARTEVARRYSWTNILSSAIAHIQEMLESRRGHNDKTTDR